MTPIPTNELQQFLRKYRFAGSRLLRCSIRTGTRGITVDLLLRVRPTIKNLDVEPAPVKLLLRVEGVDEYRFLKRLSSTSGRIHDLSIGVFNGSIFLSLDALNLIPGDVAGVHDFRLSDAYVAGSRLSVEERARPG
jgi:hypothetical protein